MGVSYLKKNKSVEPADVEMALIIREKGVDASLKSLDDRW